MDKGGGADIRRHGGHQHRRTVAGDALSFQTVIIKTVTHDILSRRRIREKTGEKEEREVKCNSHDYS